MFCLLIKIYLSKGGTQDIDSNILRYFILTEGSVVSVRSVTGNDLDHHVLVHWIPWCSRSRRRAGGEGESDK